MLRSKHRELSLSMVCFVRRRHLERLGGSSCTRQQRFNVSSLSLSSCGGAAVRVMQLPSYPSWVPRQHNSYIMPSNSGRSV